MESKLRVAYYSVLTVMFIVAAFVFSYAGIWICAALFILDAAVGLIRLIGEIKEEKMDIVDNLMPRCNMAEIERVIEELQEQVDLCKEYFQRVNIFKDKSELEKLALKISVDGMQTLDVAIQTIRELQEQNGSFQRTINALMGQIQEMEAQIPKWHLVADGDLPSMSDTYITACVKGEGLIDVTFATFQSKYKKWNMTGARAYWKVIAWMELPKFEGGSDE